MIEKLLENQALQSAIIALIVVLLNSFARWVKSKVSYTDQVDEYWSYSQPVLEAAGKELMEGAIKATESKADLKRRVFNYALVSFIDAYRKFENEEPSDTTQAAVADEIEQFILRQIQ